MERVEGARQKQSIKKMAKKNAGCKVCVTLAFPKTLPQGLVLKSLGPGEDWDNFREELWLQNKTEAQF